MDTELVLTLARTRLVVGFLGERDQSGWWQSSFFTPVSSAFLTPLFGRTQLLAQCTGVTQAAALVHDEHIGVGHVYHLFRLPENVEQSIHQVLHTLNPEGLVDTRDAAMDHLHNLSAGPVESAVGPTRVGDMALLLDPSSWQRAAALYHHAFEHDVQIYPYFTDTL